MTILDTIKVDTGAKTYPIHIGRGILADAASHLPFDAKGRKFFMLADQEVGKYSKAVAASLEKAGALAVYSLTIPAGEQTKSITVLQQALSWLLDNDVDRSSVLVAVGGGVIGDLGGFAAAIVLRGIPFVQVPTTLLAQVDSSVGGKTGINMPQGKNMVGAFHQPEAVLCDLDVLATLPRRELLAGYAEVAKYGLLGDREFFIWLEEHGPSVCALDDKALSRAVAISCRKKAEIVKQDEKETTNVRALLNLGHTFGHALETAAGYNGSLLHGEAISIGMVMAFRLSQRLGICPQDDADQVEAHFKRIGLPTRVAQIAEILTHTADDLVDLMRGDKKASGGKLVFILVRGIGKAFVQKDVDADDVRQILIHSIKGN